MDSTLIVALAGLVTTAACATGFPWIQGRVAARNAERARLHDLRITAYVAASAYAEAVEANVSDLTRPIEIRSKQNPPPCSAYPMGMM